MVCLMTGHHGVFCNYYIESLEIRINTGFVLPGGSWLRPGLFILLLSLVGQSVFASETGYQSQLSANSTSFFAALPAAADFKTDFLTAREHIDNGQYQEALQILLRLVKDDPENANLNFLTGYCIYNIGREISKAVPYLEKAVTNTVGAYRDNSVKERSAPVYAFYYLGLCYHHAGSLEAARDNLEKFRARLVDRNGKLASQRNLEIFNDVNRRIEQVSTAVLMGTAPVRVAFLQVPLANMRNFSAYGAQFAHNFTQMFYTRERAGERGKSNSEIYILKKTVDVWLRNEAIGQNLNGPYNELFCSLSSDNRFLLFASDRQGDFNIFYSMSDQNRWTDPQDNLSINSAFNETCAILSYKGDKIVFVSDRPGGFGGKDLYMVEKKDDGSWSAPANMGFVINTAGDEDTPWLSEDGQRLWFSSTSHSTSGGYDIFYSDFRNSSWQAPVNLGYPINSVADDLNYKYFSAVHLMLFSSNRNTASLRQEIMAARYLDSAMVAEVFPPAVPGMAGDTLAISAAESKEEVALPRQDPMVFRPPGVTRLSFATDTLPDRPAGTDESRDMPDFSIEVREPSKDSTVQKAPQEAVRDSLQDQGKPPGAAPVMKEDSAGFTGLKAAMDTADRVQPEQAGLERTQRQIISPDQPDTVSQPPDADTLEIVQNDRQSAEEAVIRQALQEAERKAKLDSVTKVRQKVLSDSLAAVRMAILKASEKQVQQLRDPQRIQTADTGRKAETPVPVKVAEKPLKPEAQPAEKKQETSLVKPQEHKPVIPSAVTVAGKKSRPGKEEKGPGLPDCEPGDGISGRYTVQVGAGWMKVRYFNHIRDKKICYGPDGLARFVVGDFQTKEEAAQLAAELRLLGFKDAWVASVDENRCTCHPRTLLEGAGVLRAGTGLTDASGSVRYTVQVGAGNMRIRYFSRLKQVRLCTGTDGMNRFLFGEYPSLDEARLVRDKLVELGYRDAWIPLIDENRCSAR